jgi:hypothetical protein
VDRVVLVDHELSCGRTSMRAGRGLKTIGRISGHNAVKARRRPRSPDGVSTCRHGFAVRGSGTRSESSEDRQNRNADARTPGARRVNRGGDHSEARQRRRRTAPRDSAGRRSLVSARPSGSATRATGGAAQGPGIIAALPLRSTRPLPPGS